VASSVATVIRGPNDAVVAAEELHAALWREYRAVIKDPVRGPPAGRAFFISNDLYLPWLRQNAIDWPFLRSALTLAPRSSCERRCCSVGNQ
jgi:hypothetical protein